MYVRIDFSFGEVNPPIKTLEVNLQKIWRQILHKNVGGLDNGYVKGYSSNCIRISMYSIDIHSVKARG